MTKNYSIFFLTTILCLLSSSSIAQQNEWTWMKGSSGANAAGTYGTQGVANSANTPPSLYEATQWTDKDGNFWLFGGVASFNQGSALWKFEPATNNWTWMKGSSSANAAGVYGTQGIPSANNTPGARGWGSWAWVDSAGNLWLYGGIGYGASGSYDVLSDLWKYDVATNEWTWMDGPNSGTVAVVYGTKGIPTATTSPGARAEGDAAWVDDSNRLWLFGGALYFPQYGGWSIGGFGNDVWMWDESINEWTWMQGTNVLNGSGVYGTKGVADSSNYPPGRGSYCNWKDSAGNFYLFGGYNLSYSWNDLWKYDWQTNVFTWISGPSSAGGNGTYGTQGVPDINNIPAARYENRCFWQDHCGNFWLWGGIQEGGNGWVYNDLWKYQPSTLEWTWVSGENNGNFTGSYGTQGVSSATNEPPAKYGSVGWMDNTGNQWMFGGGIAGFSDQKNDLWRYVPDSTYCNQQQQPSSINFVAIDTTICEKFCIDFIDSSGNNPVSWLWQFPGGTPNSSALQNPINICYQNPGLFDVTLITTDAYGISDTLTLTDYITVYTNPFAPVITQNGNTLTSSPATSYQWQLNSVDIPGATNQSYTITQSGLYTVVIGDENGCNAQASVDASLVGISEVDGNSFVNVYPNPSSGSFMLELLNGQMAGKTSVFVTNTLGQEIFSSEERITAAYWKKQIDLGDIARGVYFIEIKTESEFVKQKILIAW